MLCASQKIFMLLAAAVAVAFLWCAPSLAADPARLVVNGAERPVELSELEIKAEVGGGYAWTTVGMTFHNPNSRALEGELQFPLSGGQTITGFALSMGEGKNEIMRDAVPVEKQKGRQTFESIERRKVDPALLEATQGNNFKLRVYPLPPGGDRRVRLTYFERLNESGGGVLYRLPLSYGGASGKLSVNVAVSGSGGEPVQGGVLGGLVPDVKRAGAGEWSVALDGKDVPLDGEILPLFIPDVLKDGVYLGEHGGKTYFHASVPIPPGVKRQLPKSVSILWDASMSGKNRNHKLELDFLGKFFSEAKDVSVDLRQARDVADKKTEFDVRGGDWSALKKTLESVIYDGATNLAAFDAQTSADMYFLFSDGLDNYSVSQMTKPGKPLYAFVSAPGADLPRLRALAGGGGDVIDLTAADAGRAVDSVGEVRSRLAAVEGPGVSDVLWKFDGINSYIVSGIVSDPNSSVTAAFDTPDGRRVTRDIDIASRGAAKRIGGVPFLWASMKIESLEAEYDLNRGEIRRIGKAFGIATRDTSLIVLESAADYVTYGIDPPSELKAEYDRLRPSAQLTGERNKMERVLKEWRERDEWWNKDFPKGTMPKKDVSSAPVAGPVRTLDRNKRDIGYIGGGELTGTLDFAAEFTAANKQPAPPEPSGITVALRPWNPDEPYIRRMKDAKSEDLYRIYLDERPDYENSAAFYLDVAYQLSERGQKELSLRVLSNLAEMDLENRQILRVLGYRLLEAGMNETAAVIFRRVLAIADYEPQSYRDLALALNAAGNYQEAIERLYDVVERSFERNFPGIEVISLTEMNAIIANAPVKLDTSGIDPRLVTNRPLDLRVVLTWDSDNTDIDLHVADPNGEEAFYSHPLSYQGGRVSPDNTAGYGPEEYALKIAKPGKYRIEVNFYGHTQQVISESTTIQLDFFTRYGASNQEKQSVTMRLKEAKDRIFVGEFEVR